MKRPFAIWILALFLFQLVAPTWILAQSTARFEVTVSANSLNVRSGPGTDFDVIDSVKKGDQVIGLREDSGWVQVELPAGTIGWVSKRHVTIGEALAAPEPPPTPTQPAEPIQRQQPMETMKPKSGGGGGFGSVLKWTSLIGAVALGGYAYYEKTQGDDTYDEYEAAATADPPDVELAQQKWEETGDHDDKAQLYGIVAGWLLGPFPPQQFVFTSGGDSAEMQHPSELPVGLAFNPKNGEVRANLLQVRF
ncbi:MAG: SH3 domain-containing protein [Candidatus Eisenbacteria bacterium]|uniref:SH3 domain-containing protein n=1 Tax=Eiseniibacteriota bacterium TaxID=2212470 RepID=A0A956NKX1_UNCEI|nr:SH3 domain-containing protein [Candidatus Eisenbacteria bacterium]